MFMYMFRKPKLCTQCLEVGKPKVHTPGSILITLILLIPFFIPAIVYEIWRVTNRKYACACCGSFELIPPESKRAKQLLSAGKVAG